MTFVHLHTHSQYSWPDGACIIDDLVQRAVELKMPAVAITDRNSVAGAPLLWQRCIKAGIKPIIGLEIEVFNDPGDGRAFPVILLAKNSAGFSNLCRLITLANQKDPAAPKVSKKELAMHAQDLICLSFGVMGELCTLLLEDKDEEACQVADWYHGVFGEDYYFEVQNHGLPQEAVAMNKLLNLAFDTQIPVVLTNDCHYLERKDSIAIDALNCIRKGIDFIHPDAKRFVTSEYYFKTPQEMEALYSFPPQLMENTLAIADKIDVTGGYLPVSGSDLTNSKLASILEDIHQQLPDFELVQYLNYVPWTPQTIYSAVLKTLRVPEEKIKELCGLIPQEATTLLEAILIDTEFSCLSSENYLYSLGTVIADTLIHTAKSENLF